MPKCTIIWKSIPKWWYVRTKRESIGCAPQVEIMPCWWNHQKSITLMNVSRATRWKLAKMSIVKASALAHHSDPHYGKWNDLYTDIFYPRNFTHFQSKHSLTLCEWIVCVWEKSNEWEKKRMLNKSTYTLDSHS